MSRPAYEVDGLLTELDTEVIEVGRDGERFFAVVSDTILYPEGGGQPADRGSISDAKVTDVQKSGGEIRHYLDREIAPGSVRMELDWDRRYDHMQQHTGQHLLTAVALGRFGWATTAFHMGPSVCDIELDAADDDLPALVKLRLAREKELARERRKVLGEFARSEAVRLAAEGDPVISAHWDDRDLPFLQEVGKVLVEQAPDQVALLTVGTGNDGAFLLVAPESAGVDVQAAGRDLCAALDGRGGGRAPFFQGKATALECRAEAAKELGDRIPD